MIETDDPEVQTVAITKRRGSGKSLTLAWAGWVYACKNVPVNTNMKSMSWWANYYPDPYLLFEQPGVIMADEFYVIGDNRAAMTWDVRILGYLMAQGRKPGKGRYPNITFVCLPWTLQALHATDIRITPFFDWEWQPEYDRKNDVLVIHRFKLDDEGRTRTEHEYLRVDFPLARGYGNLFDTYEKYIPKKVEEKLRQHPQFNTLETFGR